MRHIALLEFQPNLITVIVPPHSYLEKTNGTLPQENCRLQIDENGLMVSAKPRIPNDSAVLLLGSSPIENLYIPEDARILSRIEQIFMARKKNVKVYSAAVSDAHLLHLLNSLMNKGIALRPRCVIYYAAQTLDIYANEVDSAYWNLDGAMTPIRDSKNESKKVPISTFTNRNKFDDTKRFLRSLCDISRNFDIVPFLATWPIYGSYDEYMQKHYGKPDAFKAQQAQALNLNEVIRDVCREKECELIDLARTFADLDHHHYFYDWNHPNKAGCELIASVTSLALQPFL